MENTENIQPTESVITVNGDIKNYLLETAKWCKFMAIVGYIGMGLLILLGLCVMVGLSIFSSISHLGFPMGLFGLIYILIAGLYFFPLNYMYKFSTNLTQGLKSNIQQSVDFGFKNLKSLFKFMGILTIIVLSIYALVIVVMVPVAIFTGLK
jgi:hypothetical protein